MTIREQAGKPVSDGIVFYSV